MNASLAELVGKVLEQGRPENLDPAATTVTNEGPDVEIVILAHRDLGGVSLVARTDKRGARLSWANVSDLTYHDDLDLGVVVERIPYEGDWRGRLGEALAEEIRRPIRLRSRRGLFGTPLVDCWIVTAGRDRRIGILKPSKDQVGAETEITTSLAGGQRPPFSLPPSIGHGP